KLAQQETADHRDTQGSAQLGADTGPERERQAGEQSRHRRHQDRPEAQQTRLVDRVLRGLTLVPFRFQGEIDHHDSVLLHDADQKNDSDDADDAQVLAEQHEGKQSPNPRRGQRGQDGELMNEAYTQNTENDIYSDERRKNQKAFVREGVFE